MTTTSAELSSSHACNICNIEFDLRFDLRSHMQQQHNQAKAEKKPLEMRAIKKEVDEVKKKPKQAKVDGKVQPALKKEKKIPAVKVMKKVKKEVILTTKEEVAPVTKKEKEEVPMEQDTVVTAAKFDEAMMEEYDEDAVGDEFLEELTEQKVATSPLKNFKKQSVQNQSTNNQESKSNAANKQTEEKKPVDLHQKKNKKLWGTEEDGGWYASSAKIVARSDFDSSLFVCYNNNSTFWWLKDIGTDSNNPGSKWKILFSI